MKSSLLNKNSGYRQIKEIIKRDGRSVYFDANKILQAIMKSFDAVGEIRSESYCKELVDEITSDIIYKIPDKPQVEQIQDIVEECLIRRNHAKVAKAYILYRAERNRVREMNTRLMKIYEDITFSDSRDSNIKRENANVNGDTAMGTMLKYGSEGAKQFYHMYILKPEHSQAHKNGDIHIHDLDFLTMTTTCCQIDLVKLFKDGFSTGHGTLREPNDIASYSALACIAVQSNQNDQHGGQSIPNFDYALADGVRKTFKKKYNYNMARNLELLYDCENADYIIKEIGQALKENKVEISINNYKNYVENEKILLLNNGFDEEGINKIQSLAYKNALSAVDRATYQAMEALIHNLNTCTQEPEHKLLFLQ